MIKSGNKLQYKPVDQAAYFFADGKAAFLITRNEGHKFLIDHTLEELETILDPQQFFRISRKCPEPAGAKSSPSFARTSSVRS